MTVTPSGEGSDHDGIFCKLPHPKTGSGTMFMFCGKDVYEVLRFKESFQSWFVDNRVQQDGSLVITSPVDPLLLAIPHLEIACKTNKFTTIDQILIDKKYSNVRRLEQCLTNEDLCNICDSKGAGGLLVYRLNEDRLMAWLILKVERLSRHFKKSSVHVTSGSQVATLIRSSKDSDVRESDYTRYAFGLLSDYISPVWCQKLQDRLQIENQPESKVWDKETAEPPNKKQRTDLNGSKECLEDYRTLNKGAETNKKNSTPLSTAQKKLAKIDKTGMKSLTSFFGAKTKK